MSALREVVHILRGITVWFVWFLLTGKPAHGRSYGELRRLTPKSLLVHLAPMAVVVAVAAHIYFNMPSDFAAVLSMGTTLGAFAGGTVVASTLLVTRIVDWQLTRA